MISTLYEPFRHWSDGGSVFILSDLHFDDEDCKLMDPNWISPEEQLLIINKIVAKNDTFVCLGDVGDPKYIPMIKAKKKILLLGNHDARGAYMDLFDEVYSGPLFISDKILLSHEPVYGLQWCLNIHGHDHNNVEKYRADCKHINLAANICGFTPVNLGKLIKDGILSDIEGIHRQIIDRAIERKVAEKKMRHISFDEYWAGTEIHTFEEINDLAEDVIASLRFDLFDYDKDGNPVDWEKVSPKEHKKIMDEFYSHPEKNFLYFAENTEFRKLSLMEATELSFDDVKRQYLGDILPVARALMRKDPVQDFGRHVNDAVSDEELDNILILRWKENLKLWTMQWEIRKNHFVDINPVGVKAVDRKDIPYIDPYAGTWKVEVDGRTEEGNIVYVTSEMAKTGLMYHYRVEGSKNSDRMPGHGHTFSDVIHALILNPETFSIEEFEDEYSLQEIEYLDAVKNKMLEILKN